VEEASLTPNERLTDVFERAMQIGVDRLSPVEQDLYLIQYFILELEMNGLSGLFYNRLPNLAQLLATVVAMRRQGLNDLADQLADALELFRDYVERDPPSTWNEVLHRYDPADRLKLIENRIMDLNDYGLSASHIGG
jgi:hypothetical protein